VLVEKRALAGMLARLSQSGEVIASPEKTKYLKDFLECRTAAKGGKLLRCVECGTHAVVYNSCNRRGCPVCSQKNQLKWQLGMRERLLPTAHHHLVFSFPDSFTQKWIKQPKATIHELLAGVRKTISRLESQRELSLGTILVFQSHCSGLAFKAHVHCLITDGGLDKDDKWQPLGVLPLGEMTQWLKQALVSQEQSKSWRIHESRHQVGGEAIVQYLGQRLNGSVVSAQEVQEQGNAVAVSTRSGLVELTSSTFALRYLTHIPPKGTVMVRSCGLYSNRKKNQHELARVQLGGVAKLKEEGWVEHCPRCKGIMGIVFERLNRPFLFDHQSFGFGLDPPLHWELSQVAS